MSRVYENGDCVSRENDRKRWSDDNYCQLKESMPVKIAGRLTSGSTHQPDEPQLISFYGLAPEALKKAGSWLPFFSCMPDTQHIDLGFLDFVSHLVMVHQDAANLTRFELF